MILLDTNIISEFMRRQPNPTAMAWVDAQPVQQLYISAITRAEIELGIALLPEGSRKSALQSAAIRMFAEFSGRCVSFDERVASIYAGLVARRVKAGRPITVEDAQIAAIAVNGGFTLATRSVGDFGEIYGLTLVDPFVGQISEA
ncbi:MAG: type II toxin-antitoxin system VapC family toxin [Actinobacteria bacterium]|nr:type II toxin-antitoxin system VapC family toxin [Actinomycetota bacterium]